MEKTNANPRRAASILKRFGLLLVLVLMVSPFVIPTFTFMGYLQGPRLWENTEKAMARGKRRAKAKSRIVKKNKPREQKPQI